MQRKKRRTERYISDKRVMVPNSDTSSRFSVNTSTTIGRLVIQWPSRLLNKWKKVLTPFLRVVIRVSFVSSIAPNKLQGKSSTIPVTIKPTQEIQRSWIIQIREFLPVKEDFHWIDLYEIKPSTISNAGYGLFAARAYSKGKCLGVYFGRSVKEEKSERDPPRTAYAIRIRWPTRTHVNVMQKTYIVDPLCGVASNSNDASQGFFGLHMANDPSFGEVGNTSDTSKVANFILWDDLIAFATADIAEGEELFRNYNYE